MTVGGGAQVDTGWTLDTLKAHYDALLQEKDRCYRELLDEVEKRYEQRFQSQEKAIEKQENATNRRFEGVNELRGAVQDVLAKTVPRDEFERAQRNQSDRTEQAVKALEGQVSTLNDQLSSIRAVVQ